MSGAASNQTLSPAPKPRLPPASPRPLRGAHREASQIAGRGAAPAGLLTQSGTRAASELPPGPLGVPARSWLTTWVFALPAFGLLERDALTGKRGPVPENA